MHIIEQQVVEDRNRRQPRAALHVLRGGAGRQGLRINDGAVSTKNETPAFAFRGARLRFAERASNRAPGRNARDTIPREGTPGRTRRFRGNALRGTRQVPERTTRTTRSAECAFEAHDVLRATFPRKLDTETHE